MSIITEEIYNQKLIVVIKKKKNQRSFILFVLKFDFVFMIRDQSNL